MSLGANIFLRPFEGLCVCVEGRGEGRGGGVVRVFFFSKLATVINGAVITGGFGSF